MQQIAKRSSRADHFIDNFTIFPLMATFSKITTELINYDVKTDAVLKN